MQGTRELTGAVEGFFPAVKVSGTGSVADKLMNGQAASIPLL